eukprot:GILJ01000798.1.p1 GENE.GILJ01000798.1~~GILJ01000798.1.p1  ORF type:complete len:552 (+),score=105.99 GILJ01000798.1:1677-3332(+)
MTTRKRALCAFALLFACVSALDCIVEWEELHDGNQHHDALFSDNRLGALTIDDTTTNVHFRMFVTKQHPWHVKFMYFEPKPPVTVTPKKKFKLPSFLKRKAKEEAEPVCTTVTIDSHSLALNQNAENALTFTVVGVIYSLTVNSKDSLTDNMYTNALAYRKQPLPGALVASRLLADTSAEARMEVGRILGVVFPKPLEEFSTTTQKDYFHSMDLLLTPIRNRLLYDAEHKFLTELALKSYVEELRLEYLRDSSDYIALLKKVVEQQKFLMMTDKPAVSAHVAERFLEIHGPLLSWDVDSSASVKTVVHAVLTNLRQRPAAIGLLRSVSRFISSLNGNELAVSIFRGLINPLTSELLDALVFPREGLTAVQQTAVRHVVKRFADESFDPSQRPDLSDLSDESDLSEPDAVFACFEARTEESYKKALKTVSDTKRIPAAAQQLAHDSFKLKRRVRLETIPDSVSASTFLPPPNVHELLPPFSWDTTEQSSEPGTDPVAELSLTDEATSGVERSESMSDASLDELSTEPITTTRDFTPRRKYALRPSDIPKRFD